jgi:hypothetical protein
MFCAIVILSFDITTDIFWLIRQIASCGRRARSLHL